MRKGGLGGWRDFPDAYLESKERHDYSHPAQCHGDVRPALFCDDIHGAQEQHRPHDIIEDHQAQKGHEDPQGDTNHLWGGSDRRCP